MASITSDTSDNAGQHYQQRLQRIIDNDINGVLVLSCIGEILFANPAAARMFGRHIDELVGESFGLPVVIDEVTQIEVLRQGKPCPVEMRITPITWPEEPALLVSLHDLSERIKFEQALAYKASHDALTDLPGQSLLLQALSQAIYAAQRAGSAIVLMVIQLNRLDMVNVGLGHAATDALQIEMARRLQGKLPLAHTVARIHNEEFVYVMDGQSDELPITRLVADLMQVIRAPFAWQGTPLSIEPCIGISIFPKDADNAHALQLSAQVALYQARQRSRSGFMLASPELNEQAQQRIENEAALRRGVANNELEMFYQPRVSLATGRITGAEALMRWRDPQRGLIPPKDFIPLAEECGLIIPMTQWALRDVCRQQKQWLASEVGTVPVSVNLCAEHFYDESLVETIQQALLDHDLPAEYLEIEITESAAMEHAEQTIARLQAIRDLGVLVALDDFGTGYSSLSYLERFPIDILKIDISFVRGVVDNPDDAAITQAIIVMARQLGYEVVAEGVENEEQRRFLARHACEEGQGYLFSKPVPATEFRQLLLQAWMYPQQHDVIEESEKKLLVVLLDTAIVRRHAMHQFLQHGGFEVYACATLQEATDCLALAAPPLLIVQDDMTPPQQEQLHALLADFVLRYPAMARVMLATPSSNRARDAAASGIVTHVLSTTLPQQRQLNFLRKLVHREGERK